MFVLLFGILGIGIGIFAIRKYRSHSLREQKLQRAKDNLSDARLDRMATSLDKETAKTRVADDKDRAAIDKIYSGDFE